MNSQWNLDNLTLTSETSTCWITEVVTLWIIHGIACNGGVIQKVVRLKKYQVMQIPLVGAHPVY